jgi:protein involved in polysaccharide export with SLBB domain
MISKLRYVSGAVIFPGTYPLADRVRLRDLVEVVGLVNSKAGSNVIVTRSSKENDILSKLAPEIIKLNSLMTHETILSGEYYVNIPLAIHEAINGFVNLSGEFKVPGEYSFSS